MSVLRDFIRSVMLESIEREVLIPPPPSQEQRVKELSIVSNQYKNRKNPEEMQNDLDVNSAKLFVDLVTSAGNKIEKNFVSSLKDNIDPQVTFHKRHFNALRPNELAKEKNIPFKSDKLTTINSPSYPSGHTAQAFYIAHILSDMHPDLSDDLYQLAQMIADSRIDRGVHFPSDNEAGKMLADILYRRHKDEE